jgi:hypothetical protein
MAIHFAPAAVPGRSPACSPIAKALAARAIERVANDNQGDNIADSLSEKGPQSLSGNGNDQFLRAALRHFAQHGISAAREARAQAEQAFFDGDRQAYDWWLGITRTLDRRLAEEAERMTPGIAQP